VARALQVQVVSPSRIVFEGSASALVVPSWDGQLGVLPGHAPMLALLGSGPLTVELSEGGSDMFYVLGGVMKVERNVVTLLTEYAGTEPLQDVPHGMLLDPEELGS
jgi:F-type H+-transporting ATPase subunit epsilon